MPRYELYDATSGKFWEIERAGATVTMTFGSVGEAGKVVTRTLPSEDAAQKLVDKEIAAKLEKHYLPPKEARARETARAAAQVEANTIRGTTKAQRKQREAEAGQRGLAGLFAKEARITAVEPEPPPPRTAASFADARNAELERAITLQPLDPAAYAVLGDWLQSQGDLRGDLVALQRAQHDRKCVRAAAALLDAHADYFLGPLTAHTTRHDGSDKPAFIWHAGYIRRVTLAHSPYDDDEIDGVVEVLAAVVAHPSGRFLAEIAVGVTGTPNETDVQDVIDYLAAHPIATLRTLHLGDFQYNGVDTEMSWYAVGDLGALWPALAQLTTLIVQGGSFTLGTIALPAVTHASFRTGGLSPASANAIATATWPQLEHLEIWYGTPEYGGDATVDDVRPLLARTDLPNLVRLGLCNTAFTDVLIAALADSPLVRQVRTLDLSMGCLSDDGARAIADHAPAFAHLELIVSENYLTDAGIALLAPIAKSVIARDQRDADPEDRYPAVGE